ncbi:Aldehyde/histidinol dehydrogenase [Metarhizium rileyi]|uniref:aldehyde dehydrogenase (NAD(+)) n=1 Tax=Metarhizium rileyi (strain RCEF 4871) TaxID=1649241 RepID=A0A166Y809_METRR|nr:Aldehyde/histidinol dehydrogenase [Metarhizium rileyi RCEF 4871]
MSPVSDDKISFTTFHNVINNELADTAITRRTDVDSAVSAAKAAFTSWSKLSQDERADHLKFADAIEANHQEFIGLLGKETGKPPLTAAFELQLVMGLARDTPKLRLKEEKLIDDADPTAIVRYIPLGVGVGIVPWNFPLTLGIGKAFPALLAGNAFILKPSPYSPYTALKLVELGARIFPPGVLQVLSGEESLGPLFTAHPDVAKISFTGSVSTGKKVMAACSSTLKRFTLELGGNDAAIVCDDVDIDSVVAFLTFVHCGEICMNIKRIYVHENIYDQFLAAMVAATKQFKTGDHADPEAFFGPVQNQMQYKKLQIFYSQIGEKGWKTALGGNSSIVVDEPFGPIVPVLKWRDEEDVIRRANASRLGLGASV